MQQPPDPVVSNGAFRRPQNILLPESDSEDNLDVDLDLDECTHLTSTSAAISITSVGTTRPKSSSPSHRSPSRTLMLAIGGMLSGGSNSAPPAKNKTPGALDHTHHHCHHHSISSSHSAEEVHILIQQSTEQPKSPASAPPPPTEDSESSTYSTDSHSSPLTSLTLSSTSSSASNFTHLTANSTAHLLSATMPRGSITPSQQQQLPVNSSTRSSTMPKAASNSSVHRHHQPTTIITQDSLLLPPPTNASGHAHAHSQSTTSSSSGRRTHQTSHSHRHHAISSSASRPSRIASCISVQSVASIASTDSSLSDYPPNTPICKFCHQRAKPNDPLISPCHCKGTIRYMHCRCLMKWLEKLKKRNSRHQPLACEICNYEYRWKKRFKPSRDWQLPPCIGNDRQWHTVFVVCAILMVISMINLIIFGEEDGHSSRHGGHSHNNYASIRFAQAGQNGGGGAISGQAGDLPTLEILKNPSGTLAVKDIFGTTERSGQKDKEGNGGSQSMFPFFSHASGSSSTPHNLSSTSLHLNNVTELLKNLSQYIPPKLLEHLSSSASTATPKPGTSKNGTNAESSRGKSDAASSANNNDALVNLFGKSAASTPTTTTRDHPHTGADHFLYHPHRSAHKTHRKNLPTKPSEVILVISGCLFFITFFLGTFAQIKSEVSFYTMIVRFIHYNQQWIIEEYDPDGGGGSGSGGSESEATSSVYEGTGTASTATPAESNEASTLTITKETGNATVAIDHGSSRQAVAVQIECPNHHQHSATSSEIAVVALPPATMATSVLLTNTPLHSNTVIDL